MDTCTYLLNIKPTLLLIVRPDVLFLTVGRIDRDIISRVKAAIETTKTRAHTQHALPGLLRANDKRLTVDLFACAAAIILAAFFLTTFFVRALAAAVLPFGSAGGFCFSRDATRRLSGLEMGS